MKAEEITFGPLAGKKRCPGDSTHQPFAYLPVEDFGRHRSKPDGLTTLCRSCHREANRRWRAEHPQHEAEYNAARRAPDVTHTCAGCGSEFRGRPNRIYCTKACKHRTQERRRYHERKGETDGRTGATSDR